MLLLLQLSWLVGPHPVGSPLAIGPNCGRCAYYGLNLPGTTQPYTAVFVHVKVLHACIHDVRTGKYMYMYIMYMYLHCFSPTGILNHALRLFTLPSVSR